MHWVMAGSVSKELWDWEGLCKKKVGTFISCPIYYFLGDLEGNEC